MAEGNQKFRLHNIPVLNVRGSNYEIGFSIGQTFGNLIRQFLDEYPPFKQELLPLYDSHLGKDIYDGALQVARHRFPQYVQEIQGMVDGCRIPFHHLFLLHIETVMPQDVTSVAPDAGNQGCTSLLSNTTNTLLLGHTEDAAREMFNLFYIVSAEVLDENGCVTESYSTLTYPGYLPGGTMGFNNHGIVHSVNSIFPLKTFPKRTPYVFIMRALLGAKTMEDVINVLEDDGCGTNDGFSLNVISAKENVDSPLVYNIEISPNQNDEPKSDLYVEEIHMGQSSSHCNKYLRCPVTEHVWAESSTPRHETISTFAIPYNIKDVKDILSVEVKEAGKTCSKASIYKRALSPADHYETIAVGIFDVIERKWFLYKEAPATSDPTVIIPMKF